MSQDSSVTSTTQAASVSAVSMPIELLRLDGGTQARAAIKDTTIRDYCAAMKRAAVFPPVVAYFDGTEYWLADGFHRVLAAKECGRAEISAEVHEGSREDALWYSCGANLTHGRQRTNADKRKAVELALASLKGQSLSDRTIAAHCGVSNNFVGEIRRALDLPVDNSCRRLGQDGRLQATASHERSQAAKERSAQQRQGGIVSPPEPSLAPDHTSSSEPAGAPLSVATPAPLVLELFAPAISANTPRRRRKRSLRRVLADACALTDEAQWALVCQILWQRQKNTSDNEAFGDSDPNSQGSRGGGCQ